MGLTRKRIEPARLTDAFMDAFFDQTVRRTDDGCLVWTGDLSKFGYGRFRGLMAHRVSLTHYLGRELPTDGLMDVDHICRNRACVEPTHLRVVSNRENVKAGDSIAAPTMASFEATGTCARGHDLTSPDAWRAKPNGGRQCYQCLKDNVRAYAAAHPEIHAQRDMDRKRAYQRGYNRGRDRAIRQGLPKATVSEWAKRQAVIEQREFDAARAHG